MISQKIRSILFPVQGLDLEPPAPEGEIFVRGEVLPTLSMLLGKTTGNSVAIEGTDDGALKVAVVGSGLETYEVFSGTAGDAASALGVAAQSARIDMTISTYGLTIAFQKSDSSWLGDIEFAVGSYSLDFSFQDVRVHNTSAGDNSIYQIVPWS